MRYNRFGITTGQSSRRIEDTKSEVWIPVKQALVAIIAGQLLLIPPRWILAPFAQWLVDVLPQWGYPVVAWLWRYGFGAAHLLLFVRTVWALYASNIINIFDQAQPGTIQPRNPRDGPSAPPWAKRGVGWYGPVVDDEPAFYAQDDKGVPDPGRHNINASILSGVENGTKYLSDVNMTLAEWDKLARCFQNGGSVSVRDLRWLGGMTPGSNGEARRINKQLRDCDGLLIRVGNKRYPTTEFKAWVVNREYAEALPHPALGMVTREKGVSQASQSQDVDV